MLKKFDDFAKSYELVKSQKSRHSRENGSPELMERPLEGWIPASAGMTHER